MRFVDAWPVVVAVLPETVGREEVSALTRGFDEMLARERRYAAIVDGSYVGHLPGAAERKAIADWATSVQAKTRRWNVGSSTVVPNPLVRGGLTAINWIWRPSSPQHAAATLEEAVDWCIARLRADPVPLPGGDEAFRAQVLRAVRART